MKPSSGLEPSNLNARAVLERHGTAFRRSAAGPRVRVDAARKLLARAVAFRESSDGQAAMFEAEGEPRSVTRQARDGFPQHEQHENADNREVDDVRAFTPPRPITPLSTPRPKRPRS